MKYTAADVSKLTTFAPWPNVVEMQPTPSINHPHHLAVRFYLNLVLILFKNGADALSTVISVCLIQASQLKKCQSLMENAEACLREGTNCYYGIEACNEVLDGHGQVIEPALRLECLCTRAALLLKVFNELL